jgi:hypothetical protein
MFKSIGAEDLSLTGKRFEFAAKEGRFDECSTEAPAFFDALSAFNASLDDALASTEQLAKTSAVKNVVHYTPSEVKEKLLRLANDCDALKTIDVETQVKELSDLIANDRNIYDSIFDRMRGLIDDFDYDKAASVLREWAKLYE